MRHALPECVGDAGDHKASVAVANENEPAQRLGFNKQKEVFHMGLQRNVLGEQVRAIPPSR